MTSALAADRRPVRLLAIGDIHLGKGADYGRHPGDRLNEQAQVWDRGLQLAREHSADAVLFAGDAFDTPRPSPQAMLAFELPLIKHQGMGGPPVIAVVGNHDVASSADGTALDVFAEAGLLQLARQPRTFAVGDVTVVCLPWTPTSRIVAAQNGGDRDNVHQVAAELLISTAEGYRQFNRGRTVLLTHFSISGSSLPNGLPVDDLREPVLPLEALEAVGYDAVVAGHIHAAQLFGDHPRKPTLYVGSPLPLDFGEAKAMHGCWLLDLDDDGTHAEFLPIPSRRFVTLDYDLIDNGGCDVTGTPGSPHPTRAGGRGRGTAAGVPPAGDGGDGAALADADEGDPSGARDARSAYDQQLDVASLLGSLADDDTSEVVDAVVKVRIRLTAEQARRLDVGELRRELAAAGAYKVYGVQLDVVREQVARVAGLDESIDDLQALRLFLEAQGVNGDREAWLTERTRRYLQETQA